MKYLLSVAILLTAAWVSADSANSTAFVPVDSVPLNGVEGRIDHLILDPGINRLYVAALGNGTVEVIDLAAGKRVHTIDGLAEPQGVVFVPGSNLLLVSGGGDGVCRVYDRSFKLLGAVSGLGDADNVRLDTTNERVWVGYGGGALAAIDPTGPAKTLEIRLDGHPESFQLETNDARVFVNVPSANEVVVADRKYGKVLDRWRLSDARVNFPMALDEMNHRLFVGCRRPAKMLVLDTESGRTVAAVDTSGDADDIYYDAARKRVYLSGGEGYVTVYEQTDPDHYALVDRVATASGARTSLFDPQTDRLFVAAPHRGGQQAKILIYKAQP